MRRAGGLGAPPVRAVRGSRPDRLAAAPDVSGGGTQRARAPALYRDADWARGWAEGRPRVRPPRAEPEVGRPRRRRAAVSSTRARTRSSRGRAAPSPQAGEEPAAHVQRHVTPQRLGRELARDLVKQRLRATVPTVQEDRHQRDRPDPHDARHDEREHVGQDTVIRVPRSGQAAPGPACSQARAGVALYWPGSGRSRAAREASGGGPPPNLIPWSAARRRARVRSSASRSRIRTSTITHWTRSSSASSSTVRVR